MRKRIYKWHRTLSLIIAIPVLLWAASGFMHPVMTNIRPSVATQFYLSPGIDSAQLKIALQPCLIKNGLDSFNNVHIVQMGGQPFYQVIIDNDNLDIRYFSTKTGNLLKNGDELYARFLAKRFLEGDSKKDSGNKQAFQEPAAMPDRDCCIMATMNIMNSHGSTITGVERLTHFDGEYKYINRLLPVYKVSFDRNDGIRIYVETASGRFGFAVDNRRAAFDRFFGLFHTWEWMNLLGNTKYFFMVAITLTAFLTTLFGLYIFFTTPTKKSGHPLVKARRNHRYTSAVASLFTLLFTFSGGFHALDKLLPKDPLPGFIHGRFASSEVNPDFKRLDSVAGRHGIQNISFCFIGTRQYIQLYPGRAAMQTDGRQDLMKSMSVAQNAVLYIDAANYTLFANGDREYAGYLGGVFSNNPENKIQSITAITKFTEEYGFISKRLPVWKVSYGINDHERYYIETSTGVLSARIRDKDLAEGYSFAFFHKHHFMDWAGKTTRDISTMFWAAMQIAMVTVGLILYLRFRRRKQQPV